MNFVTIPIIVVACYGIVELIKKTPLESKWYPVVSGSIGAVLAVLLYLLAPEIVGMTSPWSALVGGLTSGLAATGTNQVFKQLMNGELPQQDNYPYQDYNNYDDENTYGDDNFFIEDSGYTEDNTTEYNNTTEDDTVEDTNNTDGE
jgi:hypothetical protein